MASPRPRTAMLAALARRHPKAALFAAATTLACAPIWLPLLLISSPFLIFTSLLSVAVVVLLRRLSSLQQSLLQWSNRRVSEMHYARMQGHLTFEDVDRMDEGSFTRESRIHEYLDDQLKSLHVVSLARSESAEDLLPCSFSFGADSFTWRS